jgi:hypothetical protein
MLCLFGSSASDATCEGQVCLTCHEHMADLADEEVELGGAPLQEAAVPSTQDPGFLPQPHVEQAPYVRPLQRQVRQEEVDHAHLQLATAEVEWLQT